MSDRDRPGTCQSCALTSAAAVKCRGYNAPGQRGNGTTTNSSTPVEGLRALQRHGRDRLWHYHSCTLTSAGATKCLGRNLDGALGNGTTNDSATRSTCVQIIALRA